MPTLADMKTRIRAEIDRDDLDNAIAQEIASAINFYRSRRFWFNERRDTLDFTTIAGLSDYAASDDPALDDIIEIDDVALIGNGSFVRLSPVNPMQIAVWLGSAPTSTSQPIMYSNYGRELRFYPVPDATYPLVISGVFRAAAPARDDEERNSWMNEAEELIRSRAKKQLYVGWMSDMENTQAMDAVETAALNNLLAETSRRSSFRQFRVDAI